MLNYSAFATTQKYPAHIPSYDCNSYKLNKMLNQSIWLLKCLAKLLTCLKVHLCGIRNTTCEKASHWCLALGIHTKWETFPDSPQHTHSSTVLVPHLVRVSKGIPLGTGIMTKRPGRGCPSPVRV